jgi:hypothetical protein
MAILNLESVRKSAESRVFSGRDAGEAARNFFDLDRLEKTDSNFTVIVPDYALAVNLSFFLGLFGPSVRKRGENGFRTAFHFEGRAVHNRTVEEGIRRALTDASLV